MRPPEFTGGNEAGEHDEAKRTLASMRPPEFTGGNRRPEWERSMADNHASMRPPEFTGGNSLVITVTLRPSRALQ